jgi:hypothetical protein
MRYLVTSDQNINHINRLSGNGRGNGRSNATASVTALDRREPRDVEDLLRWAYQVERADLAEGPGIGAELARLGCRAADWSRPIVDGGGRFAAVLNEDAERVHETVRAMGLGRVVVRHAMLGTRPEWNLGGALRAHPVWEYDSRGRRHVGMIHAWNGAPIACKIGYTGGDAREREAAQHGWLDWWEALQSLRDELDGRLRRYRPTGPAAPLQPWKLVPEELEREGA